MSDIATLIETATNTSEGSFRRKMAVADLARSKEAQAIETLIALLDDEDAYLRREVVSGLAKTRDTVVIEPLIGVLDDDDDYLQRDAAEALGRFGDRRATEALRKLLDDDSYSVRYAAERSLKQIEERVPPPEVAEDLPPATEQETEPATDDVASPQTELLQAEPAEADAREAIVQATPVDVAWASEAASSAPVADVAESLAVAPLPPVPAPPSPTPVAPIAKISAMERADDIVTAELSTTPSSGWLGTTERQSSATPVYAAAHRNWEAARRFRTVFGTATAELEDLYDKMSQAEAHALQSEQEYRLVLERLGDEESANRDGLARLEHRLDEAAKELAELQRETNQNRRKQYKLEREASTITFQIASFMSSEKTRQNRETIRKLKSEVARLDAVAAATTTRQEKLQQQYDTLAAPLKQIQLQAEGLAESRATGRQAIGDASRRIDTWMSDHLLRLPTEGLRQRIAVLAESSPNPTLLTTCADELVRAASEREERTVELSEVEMIVEQAAATADASTDALGVAIAAGFRLTSTERRTNVRLNGSLRFSEERSTFGGFSGAEGTARGSGSGQAAYTVDEAQWAATSDFGTRVTAFADAWTRCGSAVARRELLQVLVAAARRRADDLTRLIRTEVELDFAGGGAE